MTTDVLIVVLVLESAVVGLAVLAMTAHAAWVSARRRRLAPRLDALRALLAGSAAEAFSTERVAGQLRGLPLRDVLPMLLDVMRPLRGTAAQRLRQAAELAGITAQAQAWCASTRWWRRIRGLRLLARFGLDEEMLLRLLDDPHPSVRAAACEAAPGQPTQAVLARLLRMLDDTDPLCRFAAKSALLQCGSDAATQLRAYVANPYAERPADALEIAVPLADPSFLPAALRLTAHESPLVRRRAAQVVARGGGSAAAGTLAALVKDPDPGVRAEAATGLGLLGHWPAAPDLAAALEDPSWDVRSAAAIALRMLGAPGRMYLRRAVNGSDPFASDVARQVMSLPESALAGGGR